MKLTVTQFNRIRPDLNWSLTSLSERDDEKNLNARIFYTLQSEIDTMLFWYDFMRFIFIDDVLKKQSVIKRLTNFSQKSKVYIEKNSLELILPSQAMRNAVHFANIKTNTIDIKLTLDQLLYISIFVYAVLIITGFIINFCETTRKYRHALLVEII